MRGKISKYLNKKFPLLIGATCILLVGFLAYSSTHAYIKSRNDVLEQLGYELNNAAKNLNRLYEVNIQKVTILEQNYQVQNYLKSPRKHDLYEDSMDFFYNLKALYDAIRDTSIGWKLNIYSMNENILKGSFIRDISELEHSLMKRPGLLENMLAAPRNHYRWEYFSSGEYGELSSGAALICVYKVNTLSDGISVTIDELQIPASILSAAVKDQLADQFPVIYLLNGTVPIALNPSARTGGPFPAGGDFALWLAGAENDYYILENHLTFNSDKLFALIPKDYVRGELAGVFISLISGLAVSLVFGGIFILFIIYRLKEYFKRIADIQTEKNRLELELMQSLINPHLLYNSLGGIKYAYSNEKLAKVIDSMVNFYRIALSRGNFTLTIDEEAEMARLYLEIQKFTYEADFTYSVYIDDEIRGRVILKNLIQPIVENAFLHGIKKQSPSDRISLAGRRDGEDIVFIVSDNGVGMDREKLTSLNGGEAGANGYGLRNIQKRVELHYGAGYGISVQSEEGAGTTVILRIPFRDKAKSRGAKKRI